MNTTFNYVLNMPQEKRFDFFLNNVRYNEVMDIRDEAICKFRKIGQTLTGSSPEELIYLSKLNELIDDCENFLFH